MELTDKGMKEETRKKLSEIHDNMKKHGVVEPLRATNFIIRAFCGKDSNISEFKIPSENFRKFKIYNDGADLKFTTEFYQTVQFCINPNDIFDITNFKIDYLGPIADVLYTLSFDLKGVNFETYGEYGDDSLSTYKINCIINRNSMKHLL